MPAERQTQPTWTEERLQALKQHFEAGLTCREIAAELGVSRNAVIGKISRLALTRDNGGDTRRMVRDNARDGARRPVPKLRRRILRAVPNDPPPIMIEEPPAGPVENGCSLFELSKERCRWPISTPGADDFCFCGSKPIEGLPYCPSHTRMAYRVASSR
ncbi:GcrA family cell cycle regulator [Bradyrhizobium sp. SRS-191]|uniref:GcrA family cell cycle regulator n=1 Tax=Bradyrhizobium sp. SRS-191 TaxID=2962606 RepID=UPI00211E2FFB|nr:GcrA family cell cycle regulator [Bradyrhizobium sp. SRS-191]